MDVREFMAFEGEHLPAGGTIRTHCPVCKGGQSKERSFSIYRRECGNLVGVCYRNSCSVGAVSMDSAAPRRVASVARREYNPPDSYALTDRLAEDLWKMYGLTEQTLKYWGVKAVGPSQILIPLYTQAPCPYEHGYEGVMTRYLGDPPKGEPKAQTYLNARVEQRSAYATLTKQRRGRGVVVVEDMFSAMRLHQEGVNSVCLLGTVITERGVQALEWYRSRVYLALDADATRQSLRTVLRLAGRLDIKPVRLEKDIKDMTQEELRNFLSVLDV